MMADRGWVTLPAWLAKRSVATAVGSYTIFERKENR
jgi:hypothetical protein